MLASWVMRSEKEVLELIKAFKQQLENQSPLTEVQWDEIERRREAHLKGYSKSLTWEEVKSQLMQKHGL